MPQTGQIVQVRVLGDPGCALATGKVAAVLAPASNEDGELVELDTGVVGHVCPTPEDIKHNHAVLQPDMHAPSTAPMANGTNTVSLGDIPVSGMSPHYPQNHMNSSDCAHLQIMISSVQVHTCVWDHTWKSSGWIPRALSMAVSQMCLMPRQELSRLLSSCRELWERCDRPDHSMLAGSF